MIKHNSLTSHNIGLSINSTHMFRTAIVAFSTSSYLIASSCSGGACGVTIPHMPSDIENSSQLKPFNASNKKQIKEGFNGWILVDNGGDNAIGENRLMSGVDFNSLYKDGDKLSLFGLITNENVNSGKLSYAYPLSWDNFVAEGSYSHSNYTLEVPFPGAEGIGTINSVEGKVIYRGIHSQKTNLDFSLSLNTNNINDEITNDSVVTNSAKNSYEATAYMDFDIKNYPLFNLDTNHKFYIGLSTGYLSFDNKDDEKLDQLTFKTKGSYTKINIEYKNTISLSESTSLESNFRSQYAFNDKNLDDSESFTIGGINGVKTYEESSVYSSNGVFASIEAKYKLPQLSGINNSIGTFYDYGQIWESESIFASTEDISVQDIGVGIYTSYKKFFSKAQIAFELGNSEISTKDDENYRVILQAGFVF